MPALGANPNEMSIMAEQEATDAPIKQIIEFNASEFEEAVKFTIDAIRKYIDDKDETPLNSMVDLEMGEMKLPLRGFTMGQVAQELRKNKYFVVVNSRDGTIQSNVMQQAQISKTMSTLAPMSPAWNKMSIKMAKLNGQNLTDQDLAAPQAPQPQQLGAQQPTPTETTPINAAQLKYPALAQ
jgi:hypothetical protein